MSGRLTTWRTERETRNEATLDSEGQMNEQVADSVTCPASNLAGVSCVMTESMALGREVRDAAKASEGAERSPICSDLSFSRLRSEGVTVPSESRASQWCRRSPSRPIAKAVVRRGCLRRRILTRSGAVFQTGGASHGCLGFPVLVRASMSAIASGRAEPPRHGCLMWTLAWRTGASCGSCT